MKKTLITLLILLLSVPSWAVVDVYFTTNNSSTEDYASLQAWENATDGINLTNGTVLCGTWDNKAGSIPADGTAVDWDGGSSTGNLIHASESNGTGTDQYVIEVTAGSLADNDSILDVATSTDGFDIAGTPDSCRLWLAVDDADGDTAENISVAGATTSSTNYRGLTALSADRHDGTETTGATISAAGGAAAININENNFVVEWLIVEDGAFNQKLIRGNFGITGWQVRNCVIARGNNNPLIETTGGGTQNCRVYNNIIYDDNNSVNCIAMNSGSGSLIYNNTVYNCSTGIHTSSVATTVRNNISMGNSTDFTFHGSATRNNNLSEDGTATGTNSHANVNADDTLITITAGSENLHLETTGSFALDGGSDLGTGNNIEIDIDGRDRDAQGDVWDIGADELVAAAPVGGLTNTRHR